MTEAIELEPHVVKPAEAERCIEQLANVRNFSDRQNVWNVSSKVRIKCVLSTFPRYCGSARRGSFLQSCLHITVIYTEMRVDYFICCMSTTTQEHGA